MPLAQPLLNFAHCQNTKKRFACKTAALLAGRIVWEASEREIGKRAPLVWAFFQQASTTCIILCQTAALKQKISRKVQCEHVYGLTLTLKAATCGGGDACASKHLPLPDWSNGIQAKGLNRVRPSFS